jgi:hypothetical protein
MRPRWRIRNQSAHPWTVYRDDIPAAAAWPLMGPSMAAAPLPLLGRWRSLRPGRLATERLATRTVRVPVSVPDGAVNRGGLAMIHGDRDTCSELGNFRG